MKKESSKKSFLPIINSEKEYLITDLDDIKEKKKNPFWVPESNSEIYKLKEKLIFDKKRQNQTIKRPDSKLINHTNIDKEISSKTNERPETAKNITYLNERSNSAKVILDKLKGDIDSKNGIDEEYITDLKEKIKMLNRQESVRSFISKTKSIILSKYGLEIKQEAKVRLQEAYDNECDAVNRKIEVMENTKKLFKKEFIEKVENYIKVLREKREHEKSNLNDLLVIKNDLESKKKQEENKINKITEYLDHYGDFKNFLYFVKNKQSYNPDMCMKESEYHKHFKDIMKEMNEMEQQKMHTTCGSKHRMNSLIIEKTFLTQEKKTKPHYKKSIIEPKFPQKIDSSIIMKRFKKHYSDDGPYYEKSTDLMNDLGNMETENVNFINKYNENSSILYSLEQEYEKLNNIVNFKMEAEKKKTETYENKKKEILKKNKKLEAEKEFLINQLNNDGIKKRTLKDSLSNIKYTSSFVDFSKVAVKVKDLYSKIYKNTSKYEKEKTTFNDKLPLIDLLKYIELKLDFLVFKFEYLKKTKNDDVEKNEQKLVNERKQKHAKDLMIKQKAKAEENKRKLFEKYEKVFPMQKRKVMTKYRKLTKQKINKDELVNNDCLKMEDILALNVYTLTSNK